MKDLIEVLQHIVKYANTKHPYVSISLLYNDDGLRFTGRHEGKALDRVVPWDVVLLAAHPKKILEYEIDHIRDALTEDRGD